MAELRSTDIIDKLRKLKKQIDELNIGGVTVDTLQKDGVVFQVNVNGEKYTTKEDGIIDLGTIGGLTEEQKNVLDKLKYTVEDGENIEVKVNLVVQNGQVLYTPDLYIGGEQSGAFTRYEKEKLNDIEDGAQKNPGRATTSADGLMGFSDKQKLDNIQFNANYYTIEIIDLRSND